MSQFNKDIYSGFCVAKRSCITVSILLNCEQICNTHHQLVIPVRSHLCLDQMSWPGMEMSVLTTVILLLIRSQTSQLLCFCCALMRPASAHDEVRLVNVWSVAHVCEKYQQNCLKILADFKSLKKKKKGSQVILSVTMTLAFYYMCKVNLKKFSQIIYKCTCCKKKKFYINKIWTEVMIFNDI